jgi:membrane associated rhomboid family serine protease
VRQPPPLTSVIQYPVTISVAVMAILATLAKEGGWDVSFMYEDYRISQGQVWRLLTSAFPHVNWIHLAFNVYWLWVFGTLVEEVFGWLWTTGMVLLFAVGSAAADFAISNGGIGLSGVDYGLFALLWVLSGKDSRFRNAIDGQTIALFVFWFFLCIYMTWTGIMPVGNVAHGMGAALGASVGFCIVAEGSKRRLIETTLGLVTVAVILLAIFGRSFVNLSPRTWQQYAFQGYEAILAHDYQSAVDDLKKALELNGQDADTWYNLGFAYQELEKLEEATDAYGHAYDLRPSSKQNRHALVYCKSQLAYQAQIQGKNEEAVKFYQAALALDDSNARNWYNLAHAYLQLGNLASAKEAAEHAAKLDPEDPDNQKLKDFLQKALDQPKKETNP